MKKKLSLSRETVHGLEPKKAQDVAGGQSLAVSFCCSMTCYPCGLQSGSCNWSLCICQ